MTKPTTAAKSVHVTRSLRKKITKLAQKAATQLPRTFTVPDIEVAMEQTLTTVSSEQARVLSSSGCDFHSFLDQTVDTLMTKVVAVDYSDIMSEASDNDMA